jgi:hypothetical protein
MSSSDDKKEELKEKWNTLYNKQIIKPFVFNPDVCILPPLSSLPDQSFLFGFNHIISNEHKELWNEWNNLFVKSNLSISDSDENSEILPPIKDLNLCSSSYTPFSSQISVFDNADFGKIELDIDISPEEEARKISEVKKRYFSLLSPSQSPFGILTLPKRKSCYGVFGTCLFDFDDIKEQEKAREKQEKIKRKERDKQAVIADKKIDGNDNVNNNNDLLINVDDKEEEIINKPDYEFEELPHNLFPFKCENEEKEEENNDNSNLDYINEEINKGNLVNTVVNNKYFTRLNKNNEGLLNNGSVISGKKRKNIFYNNNNNSNDNNNNNNNNNNSNDNNNNNNVKRQDLPMSYDLFVQSKIHPQYDSSHYINNNNEKNDSIFPLAPSSPLFSSLYSSSFHSSSFSFPSSSLSYLSSTSLPFPFFHHPNRGMLKNVELNDIRVREVCVCIFFICYIIYLHHYLFIFY